MTWHHYCWNWKQFSHYVIKCDPFVYQSTNVEPRIKIMMFFFYFCLIWTVENCTKLFFQGSWKPWNWKNKSGHHIDRNLIIPHFKYGVLTTFLSINFQMLILEYRYYNFWILQRLGYWKMYRNTFQDVLEAEKWAKQKWVLFFETPCICPQQLKHNKSQIRSWKIKEHTIPGCKPAAEQEILCAKWK